MTHRPFRLLFLLSLAGAVAHLAWISGQLPDVVASHFNAAGRADGHSTRATFLALYGVVIFLLGVSFGGIGALIPRLPDASVNIPHRDYWLAPERRAETLAWFADQMALMGALTMGFMVATMHLVVQANQPGQEGLPGTFGPLVIAYIVFTIAWSVWLLVRFRQVGRRD